MPTKPHRHRTSPTPGRPHPARRGPNPLPRPQLAAQLYIAFPLTPLHPLAHPISPCKLTVKTKNATGEQLMGVNPVLAPPSRHTPTSPHLPLPRRHNSRFFPIDPIAYPCKRCWPPFRVTPRPQAGRRPKKKNRRAQNPAVLFSAPAAEPSSSGRSRTAGYRGRRKSRPLPATRRACRSPQCRLRPSPGSCRRCEWWKAGGR